LKPGAPLVIAHSSFSQQDGARCLWLNRYAAFATASGVPAADVEKMRATVEAQLSILSPEQDEAILQEAGFSEVGMFYAAFSWRGWVAYG
jgi:tRNA (cmo5U34)-methyltransferase